MSLTGALKLMWWRAAPRRKLEKMARPSVEREGAGGSRSDDGAQGAGGGVKTASL